MVNERNDIIFALAPMAGVTNRSYRQLIRETSGEAVDLIFSEMINATGVSRTDRGTLNLLPEIHEACVVQIYGNNVHDFCDAAEYILKNYPNVPGIDVNAACPVRKVVRNGSGSALMHDTHKLKLILTGLKEIVKGFDKTLSLKIRKGWEGYENYLEVLEICEDAGVDFCSLHGRTVEQMYSGVADTSILEGIQKGNCKLFWTGDVFDTDSVMRLLNHRDKIDGILFARGTFGNPWIMSDSRDCIEGKTPKTRTFEEKKHVILRHAQLLLQDYSKTKALGQFKRFIAGYTKGIRNIRQIRNDIYRKDDLSQLLELLISTISTENERVEV